MSGPVGAEESGEPFDERRGPAVDLRDFDDAGQVRMGGVAGRGEPLAEFVRMRGIVHLAF